MKPTKKVDRVTTYPKNPKRTKYLHWCFRVMFKLLGLRYMGFDEEVGIGYIRVHGTTAARDEPSSGRVA
jgi:hypothetical protein